MAETVVDKEQAKQTAPQAPKPRDKAVPKPAVDPASLIPADKVVRYQAAPGCMLPIKADGKFTFVGSEKPVAFDKSKIKHQMLLTIEQEIKAGRLKEV